MKVVRLTNNQVSTWAATPIFPDSSRRRCFGSIAKLRASASPAGVSASDAVLLASLIQAPGLGVSELALEENVGRSVMSERVKRLEAAGLICRAEAPPQGDRRRVGLSVTAAGRKALTEIKASAGLDERAGGAPKRRRPPRAAGAVEILLRFDEIQGDCKPKS